MNYSIKKITELNDDFHRILSVANEYYRVLYPEESNYLDGLDELLKLNVYMIGAYNSSGQFIAMAAVKSLHTDIQYGEVKRMFVLDEYRGKGLARKLLQALEDHIIHLGISCLRLETGIYQPEAIALYESFGFQTIEAFAPYQPDPLSVFMEKKLGLTMETNHSKESIIKTTFSLISVFFAMIVISLGFIEENISYLFYAFGGALFILSYGLSPSFLLSKVSDLNASFSKTSSRFSIAGTVLLLVGVIIDYILKP